MTFLGIDIGGRRIKAGLVDERGGILRSCTAPTPDRLAPFKAGLAQVLREVLQDEQVEGAGAACKGVIDAQTRIVSIPGVFRFLEGQLLSSLVCEALGHELPVYADNDARVALVGEMVWGAARGKRNAVLLTLGTGVGGAALVDGCLLHGQAGVAGHFGHISMSLDGPLCNCGNSGCLEVYFSAVAIEAEALAAIRRSSESRLTLEFGDNPERLRCADVFRLAEEGDQAAREIRDRAIAYLAAAVVSLVHALDPEVVILSGQISRAGACILDTLNAAVAGRTRRLAGGGTPVVLSHLKDPTGIVGAAALAAASIQQRGDL